MQLACIDDYGDALSAQDLCGSDPSTIAETEAKMAPCDVYAARKIGTCFVCVNNVASGIWMARTCSDHGLAIAEYCTSGCLGVGRPSQI